ncbi:MAG TPA: DUF2321 domain-containing protein [Gemmatimonadales bacterium]|nr:DUF2321 domain-containing protein [Gemmatimonadales bacterium]
MSATAFCQNGHRLVQTGRTSVLCPLCGGESVSECPGCREPLSAEDSAPPKYCGTCGRPFPWTELEMSGVRVAIRELAGLAPFERYQLRRSIDHVIRETPETPHAIARINGALARIGGETAASLRELFLNIAAEDVKPRLMEGTQVPG